MLKLPPIIKSPLIRSLVEFPHDISPTLRFKVAETESELEQAFKLLHDAYVSENLMTPHQSGLRVTKYHALPSTTTLIALENQTVVGTVSLIRQSSFGLPLESIFDLSCAPTDSRVAEVSSLAIKKEYQSQRGRILFPLLKFLYHYSYEYFGVSHFVIAVNPKWIDFYTSVLLFSPLSKKVVENYSFVNGAPAVGGILNLSLAQKIYYQVYNKKPQKRNLSAFFQDLEGKNMEFPLRKKGVISDPILSPKLLKTFFIDKTDCLSNMNDFELSVLRELYNHSDYLKLIPQPKVVPLKKARKEKRFETSLQGRLLQPNNLSIRIIIRNVGLGGVGGIINSANTEAGPHRLLLNIEENRPCEVVGHFTWLNANGHFGFKISEADPQWAYFIQNLDQQLIRIGPEDESATSTAQPLLKKMGGT